MRLDKEMNDTTEGDTDTQDNVETLGDTEAGDGGLGDTKPNEGTEGESEALESEGTVVDEGVEGVKDVDGIESKRGFEKAKFSPYQQQIFDREQSRLSGKVKAERALRVAAEAKFEAMGGGIKDETILSVASKVGLLPMFIEKDGAVVLEKADNASKNIRESKTILRNVISTGNNYRSSSGQEWNATQLMEYVDRLEDENQGVMVKAESIRRDAVRKAREVMEAGMLALKTKKLEVNTPTKTTKVLPKPPTSPSASVRRDVRKDRSDISNTQTKGLSRQEELAREIKADLEKRLKEMDI